MPTPSTASPPTSSTSASSRTATSLTFCLTPLHSVHVAENRHEHVEMTGHYLASF